MNAWGVGACGCCAYLFRSRVALYSAAQCEATSGRGGRSRVSGCPPRAACVLSRTPPSRPFSRAALRRSRRFRSPRRSASSPARHSNSRGHGSRTCRALADTFVVRPGGRGDEAAKAFVGFRGHTDDVLDGEGDEAHVHSESLRLRPPGGRGVQSRRTVALSQRHSRGASTEPLCRLRAPRARQPSSATAPGRSSPPTSWRRRSNCGHHGGWGLGCFTPSSTSSSGVVSPSSPCTRSRALAFWT